MMPPRDGCFSAMCLAALGKLQHSHYYYSQVVPRYGGVWYSNAEEAAVQYVVVPSDIALICRDNMALRRAVKRLLYLKKRLVNESMLTDALAERRMLMPTEIEERRVVIPQEELTQWREDERGRLKGALGEKLEHADKLTKAMEAAGLWALRDELAAAEEHVEAAAAADADTQTPQPATEEEAYLKAHTLEFNLPPLCATVRQGERRLRDGEARSPYDGNHGETPRAPESPGSPGAVEYYGNQQAGFNAELSMQLTMACDSAKTQLSKLVQYTSALEASLAAVLDKTSGAMADFNLQYAPAVPETVTAASLSAEWALEHPPHDIHNYPLAKFGNCVRKLLTRGEGGEALPLSALDSIFHGMQPAWDCYTGSTTEMSSDSSLLDLINGHRIAFTDPLAMLKEQVVHPMQQGRQATAYEVGKLERERETALASKSYQTSETCGMGVIEYLEEGLKSIEHAMKELVAGAADVAAANNNVAAFTTRRARLQSRLAGEEAKLESIHEDKVVIKKQELALVERLDELQDEKKAESKRMEQLMNENHAQQLDVMRQIKALQTELQGLCQTRAELCAEDVATVERVEWGISCVKQRQKVTRDVERWWTRLVNHQEEHIEMLRSADTVYERLGAIIGEKEACDDQLEKLLVTVGKQHLETVEEYLSSVTRMLGSYTTRLASLDVHERATQFHVNLAHDAMDQTVGGVADLSAKLLKDRITVQKLVAGLNDRVAARMQGFNDRSGVVLSRNQVAFENPVMTFHNMTEALESRTADALLGHLENEKEAVSKTVVEGLAGSRPPSPTPGSPLPPRIS